jgi:hypothetical protein
MSERNFRQERIRSILCSKHINSIKNIKGFWSVFFFLWKSYNPNGLIATGFSNGWNEKQELKYGILTYLYSKPTSTKWCIYLNDLFDILVDFHDIIGTMFSRTCSILTKRLTATSTNMFYFSLLNFLSSVHYNGYINNTCPNASKSNYRNKRPSK